MYIRRRVIRNKETNSDEESWRCIAFRNCEIGRIKIRKNNVFILDKDKPSIPNWCPL